MIAASPNQVTNKRLLWPYIGHSGWLRLKAFSLN